MLTGLIRLARPKDWAKNVFIVLPAPFALAAKASFSTSVFLLGFAGFCLISSAIYTFNDLCDAKADSLHPKKRFRPIASGAVPVYAAAVQVIVLFVIGLALCMATWQSVCILAVLIYTIVNVGYNLGVKHIALLDVFFLSSGYVIRVFFGCALVSVTPSPWLLLCTTTLALFLGFAKRRADITEEIDFAHRPSLRGYSRGFLDQAVGICAGITILSYALYCIESKNVLLAGREMASMPFVMYGVLNYLRMVYVEGAGGSPVEIAYHSITTQFCAIGWIVAVTWSMGMWGN